MLQRGFKGKHSPSWFPKNIIDLQLISRWGEEIGTYLQDITVVNSDRSGTSARSYNSLGYWYNVLQTIVSGDCARPCFSFVRDTHSWLFRCRNRVWAQWWWRSHYRYQREGWCVRRVAHRQRDCYHCERVSRSRLYIYPVSTPKFMYLDIIEKKFYVFLAICRWQALGNSSCCKLTSESPLTGTTWSQTSKTKVQPSSSPVKLLTTHTKTRLWRLIPLLEWVLFHWICVWFSVFFTNKVCPIRLGHCQRQGM